MDVLEYLTNRYAGSRTLQDPHTFICPNPACDDESGHFKVWLKGKRAYGYCVKCAWPDEGDRSLWYIISRLEGISVREVKRRFGVLEGESAEVTLLQDPFAEPEAIDLEAVLAGLEETERSLDGTKVEKPQAPSMTDPPPANPGVRGLDVPAGDGIPPDPEHLALWNSWFPSILEPVSLMGRRAQEYLAQDRDPPFTAAHVQRYHLRYAEMGEGSSRYLAKKFHNRIMIPVFQDGKLVFCQGRALNNKMDPKYDSPWVPRPGEKLKDGAFPWKMAGHTFFGIDQAWGRKTIILVEGLFDAMRLGAGALALLGKGRTLWRRELLIRLKTAGAQKLIIWVDNDVSMEEIVKIVQTFEGVLPTLWTTSRIPGVKDPAEMTIPQAQQTIAEARELSFVDSIGLDL